MTPFAAGEMTLYLVIVVLVVLVVVVMMLGQGVEAARCRPYLPSPGPAVFVSGLSPKPMQCTADPISSFLITYLCTCTCVYVCMYILLPTRFSRRRETPWYNKKRIILYFPTFCTIY